MPARKFEVELKVYPLPCVTQEKSDELNAREETVYRSE
jgi:hypothetical protein